MKRRCAPVLPLLFALLLALAVSGCSATRGNGKVLRIGVRGDIPDFGYQNPDSGRFYGLEVDIAEEMARRMGYTAELVADTAEARAELLENGTVDCLIACYTITDARRERFDFSAPYYYDNTVAVVESTTGFNGLRDLRSARVGVLEGSTAGDLFTAAMAAVAPGRPGFALAELGSYEELSAALARGEVDAVCMDNSIANKYMAEDPLYSDRVRFVLPDSEQAYGVATLKESALSAPIAEAIDAMLADGTIDAIVAQWS